MLCQYIYSHKYNKMSLKQYVQRKPETENRKEGKAMKRNMMKISGDNWKNIPERYQLTVYEIQDLKEMIFSDMCPPEKWIDVTGIVFRYGFELGRRYEKQHGKKTSARIVQK